MLKLLEKIFGAKRDKDVQALYPIVDEINEIFEELQSLSDEELRGKTDEFRALIRERIQEDEDALAEKQARLKEDITANERDRLYEEIADLQANIYATTQDTLNEILPEAFAVVKEACRRHVGKQWEAGGAMITWEMVHYDVQLIGGIVLHQGKISEMATGEGKTLVGTLPTYLNALPGRGLHIITVNDYLARRDSEWMGPIYKSLGLTVGCIQSSQPPHTRKPQYECDITFGTNNEFGFDYLRDNMSQRSEDVVQRPHNFAIVDEVDSVLIDEARTPLIISGPVPDSDDQSFDLMKPRVERLVQLQLREVNKMLAEAEAILGTGNPKTRSQAGVHLLRANRGMPKNNKLMKLLQEGGNKRLMEETELEYLRDKGARMHEIDDELFYSIDEKNHTIDLSDRGRQGIASAGEDPDIFLIPDLASELSSIDGGDDPADTKLTRREEAMRRFAERSDRIHTVTQLLRAYSLYERDVEYVVDEGKIKIVDTFTGRILEGRRYSEGLHQAIEAKESVHVEEDTQTFATVTIQNYFRLYKKLAGMTGTAETEEGEFAQIYKLDVVVIPTNRPIARNDMNDLIYRTKRAKYNAVMQEIERMRQLGRPVLVGTTSVDVSETISRMLQRAKIPHNVLNAKQHEREAEVVANAGLKGAVTIATNMAGRGTDIKLGPGVRELGGLHILGTERHESRRIDRQLRGRAGRQGDPGSSQFYISLEDNLMRLFGGDRITRWMEKVSSADDVLESPMLTKAVERAQKKVEENNFAIRKRLLEYDDVMNQQREVIYDRRRHALHGERLKNEVFDYVEEWVDTLAEAHFPDGMYLLRNEIRVRMLIDIEVSPERAQELGKEALKGKILEAAMDTYNRKEQRLTSDFMAQLERFAMLHVIDDKWREHLRAMDELKEGIHLRSFSQRDPLVEYKKEAYGLFTQLISDINLEVINLVFRYEPELRMRQPEPQRRRPIGTATDGMPRQRNNVSASRPLNYTHRSATGMGMAATTAEEMESAAAAVESGEEPAPQRGADTQPTIQQVLRDQPKIGRNDPCYCGSGKKFKQCHGRS
ncbi:MAG: preprotein translocase subunit SecA [Chlorobi bacterium]|nr:preprotein translocase subunit SecA [Chlorobiota bacterium]